MASIALSSYNNTVDHAMPTLPPVLEAYIGEIRKNLRGLVPSQQAEVMLQECAYWIERHAQLLEQEGLPEDGLEEAIRLHGNPKSAALNIVEDYFEMEGKTPLTKRIGRANLLTLTIFGMGNLLYLVLLQICVYFPSVKPVTFVLNPKEVRNLWPEPLPFPEFTWQFLVTAAYPLLAPVALGWWVGRIIPAKAASVVFWSLMPLIIAAFFVGTALLPNKMGLVYAIVLTLYWLPVGSLSAHLSSSRSRKKRQALV